MKNVIEKLIFDYVASYPERKKTKSRWQKPLVAYADPRDSLFPQLKELISPSHALPQDFLPDAKTVITYFLPFAKEIVESNLDGVEASLTWGIAYQETNQLIADLNQYLHQELDKLGYTSTIIPATHNFHQDLLMSDWSHRHVAYIAGLGTFGRNNMMITAKGCCGRVGSIVTNLKLEPTKRPEREYCLDKEGMDCNVCVSQCVNGALASKPFDRHACYEICRGNNRRLNIGKADVCGKCVVGLPCSYQIPDQ